MMEPLRTANGYYSILRYVPDLERGEGANIGVVLFCPELGFLKAKTARGNDRVRRFFRSGEIDLQRINAFKEAFEERIALEAEGMETLEDFRLFVDTRANQLRLSEPRPMKVFKPVDDLEHLFESLVGGRQHMVGELAVIRRELKVTLNELLESSGAATRVQRDVAVDLPLLDRRVVFPIVFQNGAKNAVQTEAFESNVTKNIDRASVLAVEGIALREIPEPLKLNVVGSFRPEDQESQQHVKALLTRFGVDLHTGEELQEFVDFIVRTAH
jgi:hypothetical protein